MNDDVDMRSAAPHRPAHVPAKYQYVLFSVPIYMGVLCVPTSRLYFVLYLAVGYMGVLYVLLYFRLLIFFVHTCIASSS